MYKHKYRTLPVLHCGLGQKKKEIEKWLLRISVQYTPLSKGTQDIPQAMILSSDQSCTWLENGEFGNIFPEDHYTE